MMRVQAFHELKLIGLTILTVIFVLKIYLASGDLVGIAMAGAGLAAYVAALVIHLSSSSRPRVLWDAKHCAVAIIRSWTVEVASAKILSSVPIGIDLSHSGRKVLQSMYTRFLDKPGGTLVFFITRPMGNQSTRVGYLVRRRELRLRSSSGQVDNLAKMIAADCMILERSMRAAYPHLPVIDASFVDIITSAAGGLENHVVV